MAHLFYWVQPMATRSGSGIQLHSEGEIDLIDAAAALLFGFAGVVLLGLDQMLIDAMQTELWAASGSQITVSLVVSVAAVVASYATNQVPIGEFSELELGAALFMLISLFLIQLAPGIRDLVTGSAWLAGVVLIAHLVAYYLLAHY